jgi:RNA-directed DNA polymerase
MHDSPNGTGMWLKQVLLGYYRYFAVPGNSGPLIVFRYRVQRYWLHVLRRRSQRGFNWQASSLTAGLAARTCQ